MARTRWRRRPTLLRRRERGAVTVLVAVVLGGGVLMGAGAVAVDIGRLYAEREQLQSGADAAVLAVAMACARTPTTCASTSATVAAGYANSNANDGTSGVSQPCGRGPGLGSCAAPPGDRTACLGTRPSSGNYVEVRASTRLPSGSTLLPPSFAQAITGNEGYQGHQVATCARSIWGSPSSSSAGPAFTFSQCEWNIATNNGVSFQPAPGFGAPSPAGEVRLDMHDNKGNVACPAGPSGWDRPGGFGWLDENVGACQTSIAINGTYGGNTGNSVSSGCKTMLPTWRTNQTVLLLPIYLNVGGNGSNTTYLLSGLAPFVVTGYYFSGFNAVSTLTGAYQGCGGSDRCLLGYFVRTVLTGSGAIGGPDFGASIVKLNG